MWVAHMWAARSSVGRIERSAGHKLLVAHRLLVKHRKLAARMKLRCNCTFYILFLLI